MNDLDDEVSYFDGEDYIARSPGLAPVQPSLGRSTPPPFVPLWLPQDVQGSPLAPVYFEYQGDGAAARQQLYDHHGSTFTDTQFAETLLLHQMAPMDPRITLALGMDDFLNDGKSSMGNSIPLIMDDLPLSRSASIPEVLPSLPKSKQIEKYIRANTISKAESPLSLHTQTPPTFPTKSRKRSKTRLGLPITLNKEGILATVLACADTGADENIISDDLAKSLGYKNYTGFSEKKEFVLANGTIVEAIGQIESTCSFGVETEISVSMRCMFYVLLKVTTPIIMGMGFLEETKTMTHHRDRLVRVPRPAFQALSVCSINRPKKLLVCQLDYKNTLATADSGSEIDLMSPGFASELGFQIRPGEAAIELADGSIAITTGFARAQLSVNSDATGRSLILQKCADAVEFLILEGLAHDLIVGEDSLEELQVFTTNQHALVTISNTSGPLGLNRIRLLSAMDRVKAWMKGRLWGSNPNDEDPEHLPHSTLMEDLRENDRREREVARIAALPDCEQEAAMEIELHRRRDYNDPIHSSVSPHMNLDLTPRLFPSPRISYPGELWTDGAFKCNHPGCSAAPFQTQYLLNSHANIHSQARPHFCPVSGCPRSIGGKGFKRKNDMIRHGLVHDGPEYVCPFCIDREDKHPRRDNLNRHVRVHHPEKSKDDPQLRAVLAQRPEIGSRGRRRRIES